VVADAYYVLSDTTRRQEYDALYASRSSKDKSDDSNSSANFFSQFASMFTGSAAGGDVPPREDGHPDPEEMFADVFEEVSLVMLA
jgi:DnaJ-class molecular chaperone